MASTLPSAKELMERAAQKEAEKAADAMRLQAKAEAEKQALMDRLQRPSGVSDEEAIAARQGDHRARRQQWPDPGSSLSVPQQSVHGSWARHQSAGSRLRQHLHWIAEGNVRFLGTPAEAARLQAAIPDRRLPERSSG